MRSESLAWRRCALVMATAVALAGVTACGGDSRRPPTQPTPIVQPPVVDPTPQPAPGPAPTLGVSRILAFGDSITEGVDSPPMGFDTLSWNLPLTAGRSQSYPFKLKALMDARYTGQSIVVYNGGFAGRQAREDRERFSQAMSEGKPDLILLLEGANDLNATLGENEGINARVTSVVDALEDFVREATFRNIPVLIGTQTPQRPGGPKAGGVELLPRFNEALRTMAAKKNAGVVELSQLPLSFIGQDGLHPSEAGYQRIAEMWLDAIKARYERAPQ
jgi:lysophospholipase L1-like esterase